MEELELECGKLKLGVRQEAAESENGESLIRVARLCFDSCWNSTLRIQWFCLNNFMLVYNSLPYFVIFTILYYTLTPKGSYNDIKRILPSHPLYLPIKICFKLFKLFKFRYISKHHLSAFAQMQNINDAFICTMYLSRMNQLVEDVLHCCKCLNFRGI